MAAKPGTTRPDSPTPLVYWRPHQNQVIRSCGYPKTLRNDDYAWRLVAFYSSILEMLENAFKWLERVIKRPLDGDLR